MSRRVPQRPQPQVFEDIVRDVIKQQNATFLKDDPSRKAVAIELEAKADLLTEAIVIEACQKYESEDFDPDCEFYEFKVDPTKFDTKSWKFDQLCERIAELLSAEEEVRLAMDECGKTIGDMVAESEEFQRFRKDFMIRKRERRAKQEAKKAARDIYLAKMKEAGYASKAAQNGDDEEDEEDSDSYTGS